jgi:PAS domain S-box-containing protein
MLNTPAGRKKAPEPWPIAAVADAVVTTDDSWMITSWNRPMEELFGWAEATVVGRDMYSVLGLDNGSGLRRDLPRALLNHGRWEGDVDGLHRDGDARPVRLSVCFLRGTEDAPAGILAVARPHPDEIEEIEAGLRVDDDEVHSEPGLPGLFVLHYQPEVNLEHLAVVSCEALLRWHHPGLGLLSPGGFLGEPDLAARLEALGAWTFFAACRQAAIWTADHDMRVTVNVSGQQLADRELATRVRLAMTAAGVETGRFGVEVSADQLGLEPATTRVAMAALEEVGAVVLLDDVRSEPARDSWVGLPLAGVKLGRSLIDGLATTPERRVEVESTIAIAHDLGLWVTAEGIENPADLDCVRELGCDGAFGFLLHTPSPAREIEHQLDEPLAVRWDRVDAL